ncbi:MAG: adenosylcobinamide-GDP ribazoletransferase [Candidatus Omnitrophota bacterium]
MIRGFILALQFLTIIPFSKRKDSPAAFATGMIFFPIAGLILGAIMLFAYNLFLQIGIGPFLSSALLVILLIILTGGLHLDGLGDTVDALYGGVDKADRLRIMREPHIGTMGTLSIVSIVCLKIALLYELSAHGIGSMLLFMGMLSRYGLALAIFLFPYARKEGKAKLFFYGASKKIFFPTAVITLICSMLILGLKGLVLFVLLCGFVWIAGRIISKKIGGLTGDNLGAICEISEVFILLVYLMIQGGQL